MTKKYKWKPDNARQWTHWIGSHIRCCLKSRSVFIPFSHHFGNGIMPCVANNLGFLIIYAFSWSATRGAYLCTHYECRVHSMSPCGVYTAIAPHSTHTVSTAPYKQASMQPVVVELYIFFPRSLSLSACSQHKRAQLCCFYIISHAIWLTAALCHSIWAFAVSATLCIRFLMFNGSVRIYNLCLCFAFHNVRFGESHLQGWKGGRWATEAGGAGGAFGFGSQRSLCSFVIPTRQPAKQSRCFLMRQNAKSTNSDGGQTAQK